MLTYHIVLNADCVDYPKQARELNGFVKKNCIDVMKQGTTWILCNKEQDLEDRKRLAELSPTKSVVFVIQNIYEPESALDFLESMVKKDGLYLFGSNFSGWEMSVRLGQRSHGSSILGCMSVSLENNQLFANKMVYSNHMKGSWRLEQAPYCIAIAKGQNEETPSTNVHEIIQEINLGTNPPGAVVRKEFQPYKETGSLEEASFVLVAGRGVAKKETAAELSKQAEQMGAAFGASRPVVMNAWAPMEKMVGVSGNMLKPEICIAAGVSGAPAFYAGIEKSKFVVAINSDERAPILKKADVAIVGDCKEAINALALLIEGGAKT